MAQAAKPLAVDDGDDRRRAGARQVDAAAADRAGERGDELVRAGEELLNPVGAGREATSGSSSSRQLPARSWKTSPQGKLGPVTRILNVRGVQLWLPQGSSTILWMTSVAPSCVPAQEKRA